MNNEKQPFLESFEIPEIKMEDMIETIETSKQILKEAPLQKREPKKAKQLFTILRLHFPRLLFVEAFCCILATFFLLYPPLLNIKNLMSDKSFDSIPLICFLTILMGSLIFTITAAGELLRSRIASAWEMEKVCAFRIEKIIMCKLMMMSVLAFLGIGMLSIILAAVQPAVEAMTIFLIGILPYLIITTSLVQFQSYINSIHALLAFFVVFTSIYLGMLLLLSNHIAALPLSFVLILLVAVVLVCFSLDSYKLLKKS